MRTMVVGVADCKVTDEPAELVTFALGSCIAVVIWDPEAKVGGLLHFMLPESAVDRETQGRANPYRYADTGTPLLFRQAYEKGAEKRRLQVRLAGGASVVDTGGVFNIGRRNHAAVRKILWRAGVLVHAEDVGGSVSRTVRLDVATGRCTVSEPSGAVRELRAGTPAEWAAGGAGCQLA